MHQGGDDVSELIPYFFVGYTYNNLVFALGDVYHQWLSVVARKITFWLATFDIFEVSFCMNSVNHSQMINLKPFEFPFNFVTSRAKQ